MNYVLKRILSKATFVALFFTCLFTYGKELNSDSVNSTSLNSKLQKEISFPQHSYKKHNLGIASGLVSGFGTSYRTWNESGKGHQFTLTPLIIGDSYDTFFLLSAGYLNLSAIKDLPVSSPNNRFFKGTNIFKYYGGHFMTNFEKADPNSRTSNPESVNLLSLGGGIGTEIHFSVFNWTLMGGFAGTSIIFNNDFSDHIYFFSPTAETALYFNF